MTALADVTKLMGLALPDHVVAALLRCLEFLTSSLTTPCEQDRAYDQLVQVLRRWANTMDRRVALRLLGCSATPAKSRPQTAQPA